MNQNQIKTTVYHVLRKSIDDETERGNKKMDLFTDKNTKLELAKALIEKLIGLESVKTNDINSPSVLELIWLRNEVYRYNEEVIDELVESYRLAYLTVNNTSEGE